jgi:hypothetical protein
MPIKADNKLHRSNPNQGDRVLQIFNVVQKYLLDFLAILESVYLKAIANHKFQEECSKWHVHKVQ